MAATDEDATIGGDLAPHLTLGTGRRTLYVMDAFNHAEWFPLLPLDYFLSAETDLDFDTMRTLEERGEVAPGEPQKMGTFLGKGVWLYPLRYLVPPPASD